MLVQSGRQYKGFFFVIAAAPDQRAISDAATASVAGRGVHDGHRQGGAVGADVRPRQSRDGHVGADLVAAGQFQLPARRVRQPRRCAHRQARHLPAHHLR